MSILVISDLHLDDSCPKITALFLKFLKEKASQAEALYILGDFFEAWIGDDNLTDYNLSIIKALHTATEQGLPIYIMHGNRDFLLGRKFLQATGCQLLPDEYVVNLYGVPTLMMHGDTLCREDPNYLAFRKKTRRWWVQQLFLLKSLKSRRAIAQKYREGSKAYTSTLPDHIMDVTLAEVDRVMLKHRVQRLIHGHTHREGVHHWTLEGKQMTRMVLGAWHECGSVLVCEPTGESQLVTLSA